MVNNWPDIVSLAWSVFKKDGILVKSRYSLIQPDDWVIPDDSIKIHGITNEQASNEGRGLREVIEEFNSDLQTCDTVVAHNMEFDKNVLFNAYKWRLNMAPSWPAEICTMLKSEPELKLPRKFPSSYRKYKSPTLTELYQATFGREPTGQHNSQKDVEILCEVYWARWSKC
jgi:DNA polymerase III epsilon subunit-like protein